jgi:hypothetical protein
MGKKMNKTIIINTLFVFFLSACTPSTQYMSGQGFYAENLTQQQVNILTNTDNVKELGQFSISNGGCGYYSTEAADNGLVVPAVKEKLIFLGGNAANYILTKEKWYDGFLGVFIIPGLLACSNWTISGNALLVNDSNEFKNSILSNPKNH